MLLAMALAVVVLLVNAMLFGRREPNPQPNAQEKNTTQQIEGQSAISPISGKNHPGGDTSLAAWRGPGRPELIRIETEVVRAEIDPVGGAIRSWKLLHYTDAAGNPADLVRTRDLGAIWFALRLGGKVLSTDSTLYATNVTKVADEWHIEMTARDESGVEIHRSYTIPSRRYDCEMNIRVAGVPEGGEGDWEIGWVDGLPAVEKDPRADHMAHGAVAVMGKEYVRVGGSSGAFGCPGGGGGQKSEHLEGNLRWFGVRNKYFLGALMLEQPQDRQVVAEVSKHDHTAAVLTKEPLTMGGTTEAAYRLYLGPIKHDVLEGYKVGLERAQDLGPSIFRPFASLLRKFFLGLHGLIPNYGFVILILSILTRVIFYPLTKKSMDSMTKMQRLKPELDRLNERYKDDPERRNRETLELYRKHKINPLGGCLPILIQLPILSGLYFVLANAVELRKEPFILWVQDLSAPDTVAHLAGLPINILPLLMAGTMVWQQRQTPMDPRQASIGYIMPIFMTFLFYTTPSGLVFYWTVNNVLTVLQQVWANRSAANAGVSEAPITEAPKRRGKK